MDCVGFCRKMFFNINFFFQQGHIKLFKSGRKEMYVRKGFYFKQNFQTKVSKFIIKIIILEHIRIIILKDHVTRLMATKVMAALYLHYYSMIKHLF